MQRTKPKSREEQELIINEYLSSGEEVKAWCREKKLLIAHFIFGSEIMIPEIKIKRSL